MPIKRIFDKFKEKKEKRNRQCDEIIAQITAANKDYDAIFNNQNDYIALSAITDWEDNNSGVLEIIDKNDLKKLKKANKFKELVTLKEEVERKRSAFSDNINRYNFMIAKREVDNGYALIGDVEERKLDEQQMMCVVRKAHNHLIIAGAGTGKTTTVVGKIKYLLKSGQYEPKNILVLSFTNASASEMSERIAKETGCEIEASTFHKLGLNIIKAAENKVPKITTVSLNKFIRAELDELIKNPEYLKKISNYIFYNRVVAKSEFDFKTGAEYVEYLNVNPPTTFLNETVKSYGEMDIANFLYQNRVRYEYEASYITDTNDSEYGQYHPDFFLPDYGIYIEHFGIDREGNAPSYFKGRDGMSGSEAYRASMEWKRNLHKENGTVMIECYSYEKFEGSLLVNLEEHLKNVGVRLDPIPSDELWKKIQGEDNTVLNGMIELFETVINLAKSNNHTIESLKKIAEDSKNKTNVSVVELVAPIYTAYDDELKKRGEIDFNDMINSATDYVRSGRFINPYSYVIVDEYQDISKARFSLLDALRKSRDFDLFCVGDDWQSIYRFAGSDINYILNFEKYWGATEISRIETTYRFTKSLIEVSGSFIMQNPAQIKKAIVGKNQDFRFSLGEINGYNEKYAVEFMSAKLDDLPKNSSVFFIGRYSFDADLLNDSGLFECSYDKESGFVSIRYSRRPDLKMSFLTAHKSKGLQADYVFIINNKKSRMGFPSRMQDAPIIDLLLEGDEEFPFAEERRLYYVALTRAKIKAYMLTVKGQESVFAEELKNRYADALRREQFECPLCGGRLEHKNGPYGEFLGCSNYKTFGCKYKRKIVKKAE